MVYSISSVDLLFNDRPKGLASSCVVEEDLGLLQCREAIPRCINIESTHDELTATFKDVSLEVRVL
jgi:hypothetical protein